MIYDEDEENNNLIGYLIFFGLLGGIYLIYWLVNFIIEHIVLEEKINANENLEDHSSENRLIIIIIFLICFVTIILICACISENSDYNYAEYNTLLEKLHLKE